MSTTEKNLTEAAGFKIHLPQAAVDGFELEYFDINGDYLSHIRLKFHVNTKWADLEDGHGADLVNQWQVFDGPRFVGRINGWETPLHTPRNNSFHRRDDAIRVLAKRFTDRAIGYEKMARDYHDRARQLLGVSTTKTNTTIIKDAAVGKGVFTLVQHKGKMLIHYNLPQGYLIFAVKNNDVLAMEVNNFLADTLEREHGKATRAELAQFASEVGSG